MSRLPVELPFALPSMRDVTPRHAAGALAVVLSAAVIGIMVSENLGGSEPQSGGFAGLLEDIGVIEALDSVPLVGSIIELSPERGQVLEGQPTPGQATPTAQPAGPPSGVIDLGQFGNDSGIGPPDRPTNPIIIDQPTPPPGIVPPPSPTPIPGTCGGLLQPPCPTATPVPTPIPTIAPTPVPTVPPEPTPTLPPDPTPTLPPDPTPTLPPDPTPSPDTDGDGVTDDQDVCPDVPRGLVEDPQRPGCPLIDPLP